MPGMKGTDIMKRKNFKFLTLSAAVMTALIFCLTGCKSTTEGIIEEPEVDYVDEDGYIYYKNPTIWTTEMVFEELTINGQKFTSPLNLEKLGEGYSYSTDGAFYDSKTRTTCLRLMYNDKSLAWVYLDDCDSIEDIESKTYNKIQFDFSATAEELFGSVTISDCGINSTRNDIISRLGKPSIATESYYTYTKSVITPVDSYDFPGETITFYFNDDKVMLLSITLKELEEN